MQWHRINGITSDEGKNVRVRRRVLWSSERRAWEKQFRRRFSRRTVRVREWTVLCRRGNSVKCVVIRQIVFSSKSIAADESHTCASRGFGFEKNSVETIFRVRCAAVCIAVYDLAGGLKHVPETRIENVVNELTRLYHDDDVSSLCHLSRVTASQHSVHHVFAVCQREI